jgi:uncharacterized protein YprB with RNaseH-like and TPR domain
MNIISKWAGENHISLYSDDEFAFLDIETSGLGGGTGTFAFMVGVGRFDGDGFQLLQFFMCDPLDEPAMLVDIEEFLAPCKTLVTFNGKSFDIPHLKSRFTLQGWQSPFDSFSHIDLLHLSRRLWRDRLTSCTLSNLEVNIIEALRSEEEVPGWMIPQMYFDYLRSRDARPLKRVFYHNEMDILSMVALLNHITYLVESPLTQKLEHNLDQVAIARLFEDLGYQEEAVQLYSNSLNRDLPDKYFHDTVMRLSLLHKRRDQLELAIHLWEIAADKEQIYAHIELAKAYEHILRDFTKAIFWTESAIDIITASDYPRFERAQWKSDLEHRLSRLVRRSEKNV